VTRALLVACTAAVLAVTTHAADRITFDDGTFGKVKPVSGKWYLEKGKLLEMSDSWDEGRPLFATMAPERTDNVRISVDFEVYDFAGEVLVCPVWHDRDNFVAAVWKDGDTVRLMEARDGVETVLAEKRLNGVRPPLRLAAAVSRPGLRAYVNDELVLEAGAFFSAGGLVALGGRGRLIGFDNLAWEEVKPWTTDRSLLRPIQIERPVGRSAFYRMEKNARMEIGIRNLSDESLRSVRVTTNVLGFATEETELRDISPNAAISLACPIPAERLRPDGYFLNVRAAAEGYRPAEMRLAFHIVRRPHPQRFPVMMWGGIPPQGPQKLVDLGFTHVFAARTDLKYLWDNPGAAYVVRDDATRASVLAEMDKAMMAGLELGASFGPGYFLIYQRPEFRRIRRDGSRNEERPDVCPFLSGVRDFCRRSAEALARTYGTHPAFKFALVNTELRDNAQPCFHGEDIAAYRQATGQDVPDLVESKYGVSYKKLKDFPTDRVVPDDHPLLTYFRWFWRQGDGWVAVNDMIWETLRKGTVAEDFFCWFDPAVRVAPLYGSGGNLPMIGQWTYTYPDPIRVGMTADELINMARGKQKTYQMIQGMWYRSQTAPKDLRGTVAEKPTADPWTDRDPDASYITPSPAHITEAFWTAISRPVDMIGYFSLEALLPGLGGSADCTHLDTAPALADVHARVLRPFGPMLREIPDRPADVAFLESFASQVFAGHATFGWASGTVGNMWHACEYAGLQMDIIFDETIVEKGLGGYKVLVLPACEVLTQPVYDRIVAFQERGGIIIADELLVPGVRPDILIPSIGVSQRNGKTFKAAVLAAAARIREALRGKYAFFAHSEDPEVVLHTRERDGVQYLFAINDKKEFGDYVGQYGLVMENGVPAETVIAVRRTGVRVLDLVAGQKVPARAEGEVTRFRAVLGPGEGKIYVIAERLPASLRLAAPDHMERGDTAFFDVTVLDSSGAPVAATVAVEFRILDPAFRPAEPSGFYAAVGGKVRVRFDLAENERTGVWRIVATERMRGSTVTRYIRVY